MHLIKQIRNIKNWRVYMMSPAKDLNNGTFFSNCCALLTWGQLRTPYLDQMGSIIKYVFFSGKKLDMFHTVKSIVTGGSPAVPECFGSFHGTSRHQMHPKTIVYGA